MEREDGIIEKIFSLIGIDNSSRICCEFGAWDGIHLSNVRNLILNGWSGILIEGEEVKYKELVKNYADNTRVFAIQKFVDVGENSLESIIRAIPIDNILEKIDLLVIDVDGLDYEIFSNLAFRPRVICVEVNAGHHPENESIISQEIAKNNVGQPLNCFSKVAKKQGYGLVGYSGNAFYIRDEIIE